MRLILVLLLVFCVAGCGVTVGLPKTPGAFVQAAGGETFEPMDTLDPRNAMVYIYRPGNQWGFEELQAPTFFIEQQQLFGLKSGAYTWLELHSGEHEFYARRPLSILFLDTILEIPLEVEGGRTYYLRYSEDDPLDLDALANESGKELQEAGPLQQVPRHVAREEIANMRLDEPGVYYGGTRYEEPRWAPFYTYDPRRGERPAADELNWWQRLTGR